jgi:uncharacterized repeat protein (TIGR02543 family)
MENNRALKAKRVFSLLPFTFSLFGGSLYSNFIFRRFLMKKQRKSGFLALIGLAAVASLFTVCKVHGSGGDYKGGDGEQVKVWKVTFDTAGGVPEPQPNPETVADGEAIGKLPDGPEKPPATFDGWYLGDTQFAASTPVTGDITLLAKWHEAPPGSVCVTFNGDGGEPGIVNRDVSEGGTVSPLLADPTRTGYTFDGWYTQTNGGGTPFTTGTAVPEAITVYARWTAVEYTVAYDGNGQTSFDDTVPAGLTATIGTTIALEEPGAMVKTGYAFAGWNKDDADTGAFYADGAFYTMGAAGVTFYCSCSQPIGHPAHTGWTIPD